MVLGTCGIDDFKRKDWLTSFCVCPAEDAEMAEKLMRATVVRIDADSRAKRDKALIDGAGALKKAARSLLLKARGCHAHIVRLALRRGGFNDLMWDKHDEKLHLRNSSKKSESDKMKHVAHLRKNYLSPDPCCSGGRAVGIEGQPGSNQGGEKWGGQIKVYHRMITRRFSAEAKKSVIFILAAVAMDLELDANLSEFAVKPIK